MTDTDSAIDLTTQLLDAITADIASNATGSAKKLGFSQLWYQYKAPKTLPDGFFTYNVVSGGEKHLTADDSQGRLYIQIDVYHRQAPNALQGVKRIYSLVKGLHSDPSGGTAFSAGLRPVDGNWFVDTTGEPTYSEHGHVRFSCVFIQEDFRPR